MIILYFLGVQTNTTYLRDFNTALKSDFQCSNIQNDFMVHTNQNSLNLWVLQAIILTKHLILFYLAFHSK